MPMQMPVQMDVHPDENFLPALTVRRWVKAVIVLSALSFAILLVCLQYGTEKIPLVDVVRILSAPGSSLGQGAMGVSPAVILLEVRLPRLLLAFLVGASLAAVGVALQALLRNPLADPYILGISSGGALGAALAVQFGISWLFAGFSAVQLFAFLGAGMTILAVYRIAMSDGRIPVQTLLLAGVIINAILSALILFITSLSDSTSAFRLFFWLMGSLGTLGYAGLGALALYVLVGMGLLLSQARHLNLLSLGEDPAQGLGLDVEQVKRVIFFTSALLTGAAVAVSGLIGFVGMIVPHGIRMIFGPDHRLVLPAAALVGGTFLAVADTVARSLLAPTELPVGVITALCGGPFFIYLLVSRRKTQMG
jgi:ABC-type Fe3+-siderophore transport system permease subunit